MHRDDALIRLQLSGEVDLAQVMEAYKRLSRIAKGRILEAPTDSLRERYRAELAELAAARDALLNPPPAPPGGLSATKVADLPRAQPALTEGHREAPGNRLTLETGRILAGRYEVKDRIGAGGMGAVYRAFDRTKKQYIAIKVLLPGLTQDAQARERFLAEAQISTQLSHPNIVNVFDVQCDGELHFLTMELLEGRSLREELQHRKRLPVAEALVITTALTDALSYAHRFTIHRDVKPENVFLCADGTVKLMDFGIARLLRTSQLTMTGMTMGTAYYMAPEQLSGAGEVNPRADQYSLAVMLYEMVAGLVPAGRIEPLRRVVKGVRSTVSAAVDRALSASPAKRFEDADAFRAALTTRGVSRMVWLAAGIALIGGVGVVAGPRLLELGSSGSSHAEDAHRAHEQQLEDERRIAEERKKQEERQRTLQETVRVWSSWNLDVDLAAASALLAQADALLASGDLRDAAERLTESERILTQTARTQATELHGIVEGLMTRLDQAEARTREATKVARRDVESWERQATRTEEERGLRDDALGRSRLALQEAEWEEQVLEASVFGAPERLKVGGKLKAGEGALRDAPREALAALVQARDLAHQLHERLGGANGLAAARRRVIESVERVANQYQAWSLPVAGPLAEAIALQNQASEARAHDMAEIRVLLDRADRAAAAAEATDEAVAARQAQESRERQLAEQAKIRAEEEEAGRRRAAEEIKRQQEAEAAKKRQESERRTQAFHDARGVIDTMIRKLRDYGPGTDVDSAAPRERIEELRSGITEDNFVQIRQQCRQVLHDYARDQVTRCEKYAVEFRAFAARFRENAEEERERGQDWLARDSEKHARETDAHVDRILTTARRAKEMLELK